MKYADLCNYCCGLVSLLQSCITQEVCIQCHRYTCTFEVTLLVSSRLPNCQCEILNNSKDADVGLLGSNAVCR
jgi:hypothetical protein